MKVVGIISSPHRDGAGATLVREVLRGAREGGAQASEVFLPEHRIEYCRDCGTCTRTGSCAVRDDFHGLRDLLFEADGIVLSSPTYASGPCARMKNLLDRLGMYAYLTSAFGGKYVAAVATASGFGARKVAGRLASSVRDGVFRRAYITGSLCVHLRGRSVSEVPKHLDGAFRLGRRLAADIENGRRYALQNLLGRLPNALLLRPMFRNAIVKNKDVMRGVYDQLVRSGILAEAEG